MPTPRGDAPTCRVDGADVLVVDDNPANLDVLMGMLQAARYRVRVATGGRRALAAVAAAAPEVLLLDISMPDLDGYEVCRQIKASPSTAAIPVVFLSAHDDPLDKVEAFRVGGADYVTKPFQVDEVLARIEHQVLTRRLRAELEQRNRELQRSLDDLRTARETTASVFSVLAEVLPGTVLDGKYRLEARIGSGGFGAVYRATHLGLGREVAVKVLLPSARAQDPTAAASLRREGMSACRVQHPNAITVLDFGVTEAGVTYLVLELLEGHTLEEEMARRGRLGLARSAEILAPVAAALGEAHGRGLVHRDVKPANIFLHHDGSGEVVKLLDFGIATLVDPGERSPTLLTLGGTICGTPPYMSPERLQDLGCDGRSDVFSLGVVLYEMLSGTLPWDLPRDAGPLKYALEIVHGSPLPLVPRAPGIPEEVAALVLRALARDPRERPDLSSLVEGVTAAAASPGGR